MPQMGVSVAEGTILEWCKREGDVIEADEVICEISTDKIDTEVPSPAGGRVARILVAENETVAVGTVIATLAPAGQPAAPGPTGPSENGHSRTADGDTPDRSHVISPVV